MNIYLFISLIFSYSLLTSALNKTVNTARQTQRFIPFDQRFEAGSVINVPLRCPPSTFKVGNRCRTIF